MSETNPSAPDSPSPSLPVSPSPSPAPAGLRHGIKETLDVAAAIAATLAAVKKAAADGNIGIGDKLGFLRLAPELFAAIVGIGAVRQEVRDISPQEFDAILGEFVSRGLIPDDARKAFRLDIIMDIVYAIIRGLNAWDNTGDRVPKGGVVE